ncbi:hypothetical protein B0H14DRAFT_3652842 [Mycena olivaceomarginata]|nr:hypothetical protein B0H14DRAFT_3652842 [Mycena olivaceomarginata]
MFEVLLTGPSTRPSLPRAVLERQEPEPTIVNCSTSPSRMFAWSCWRREEYSTVSVFSGRVEAGVHPWIPQQVSALEACSGLGCEEFEELGEMQAFSVRADNAAEPEQVLAVAGVKSNTPAVLGLFVSKASPFIEKFTPVETLLHYDYQAGRSFLLIVMAAPISPRNRQPRPPGRNIPLKIYKGSLENREDSHGQDLLQVSVVGNINKNETSGIEEHHLQAALATSTVRIPIPGSIQLVENYPELYPSKRWRDTETYLQSMQTISEACSAALLDHDYTYFMDEADKTWLDNTNYQCRIEEQIAQETPSADTDEIFIRVSISEDEFELVMGLFEILTGSKLQQELPQFSFFKPFFLAPLRLDTFGSQVVPAWIRPPSVLSSISLTIHPHWQQRRSLRGGRKIFPSLNSEENDYINAAYAQNLKVSKGEVGRLQADSSAQNLANEREKLKKCLPEDHRGLNLNVLNTYKDRRERNHRVRHRTMRRKYRSAQEFQKQLRKTEQKTFSPRSRTRTDCEPGPHSFGGPPNIPLTVVQSEKVVYFLLAYSRPLMGPKRSQDLPMNREGTSTGQTRIVPAIRVSGSQHIPSPPKKSSGDGMADSLKGDEARPLIPIPVQTTDTKTSRQPHNHGPARDENNFFTGRFIFPPTLLESVQGPLQADGTNSTSEQETNPVDMAQKRTSICFGLAGNNDTGRAYTYGRISVLITTDKGSEVNEFHKVHDILRLEFAPEYTVPKFPYGVKQGSTKNTPIESFWRWFGDGDGHSVKKVLQDGNASGICLPNDIVHRPIQTTKGTGPKTGFRKFTRRRGVNRTVSRI